MDEHREEGRRFRNAREDATVKSIEKDIEKTYGLPDGSVSLRNSNGKNARDEKLIRNFKKDFNEV